MTTKQSEKGIAKKKKVIMKRKCFLPECTVLRSRLNSRNKYKVHLQTFIHARLQQPSRCPPPCRCMPAERWNGEKKRISVFPSEREAGTVKNRQALRVSVSLCAWTVMSSEWMREADRSLSLHTSQESEAEEGGEISLNDYPTPGRSVQRWEFTRSSQLFALREEKHGIVHCLCSLYFSTSKAIPGERNSVVSSDKIK